MLRERPGPICLLGVRTLLGTPLSSLESRLASCLLCTQTSTDGRRLSVQMPLPKTPIAGHNKLPFLPGSEHPNGQPEVPEKRELGSRFCPELLPIVRLSAFSNSLNSPYRSAFMPYGVIDDPLHRLPSSVKYQLHLFSLLFSYEAPAIGPRPRICTCNYDTSQTTKTPRQTLQ